MSYDVIKNMGRGKFYSANLNALSHFFLKSKLSDVFYQHILIQNKVTLSGINVQLIITFKLLL